MAGAFEEYPIASWTVGSFSVAFPALLVSERGANRLVERERPYRDGAKLDDTGSKAKRWSFDVIFNNTITEPGLETNGFPLYPDALNQLVASFDVHETGDLVVPTLGRVRCRAETYERKEAYGERDEATVCFTFIEDNEDSVDFRQLQAPSAAASSAQLAQQTVFSAQSRDMWHPNLIQFRTAMSQLETAANAPAIFRQDLRYAATAVRDSSARTIAAFRHLGTPGRDGMAKPSGNRVERKLVASRDMAQREAAAAQRGDPRPVTIVLARDASLFDVAAAAKQPLERLLELNPQLDPLFVPAGVVVVVQDASA